MKTVVIDDVYEVIDDILQLYNKNQKKRIVVVGYYETISEILNMLIKLNDNITFIGGIIENPEWTDYEDAYYINLENGEVSVGEIYNDFHDRYLMMEADYAFIEEDFAEDYFNTNADNNVVVFGFDDVHEEEHKHSQDKDSCMCMTKDKKGFMFCVDNDFGHTRFQYAGSKVLTEDDVWAIIADQFLD